MGDIVALEPQATRKHMSITNFIECSSCGRKEEIREGRREDGSYTYREASAAVIENSCTMNATTKSRSGIWKLSIRKCGSFKLSDTGQVSSIWPGY